MVTMQSILWTSCLELMEYEWTGAAMENKIPSYLGLSREKRGVDLWERLATVSANFPILLVDKIRFCLWKASTEIHKWQSHD